MHIQSTVQPYSQVIVQEIWWFLTYAQGKNQTSHSSLVNISTSTAGWEGGGILVREGSLLEMSGETIIKDNHASSYGGAISLDFSELRIKGNSQMTNNSAQYGGAIQAVSSEVHIISGDHYFENNSAQYGGGLALFWRIFNIFPLLSPNCIHFNIFSLYYYYNKSAPYYFHRLNIHFISNRAETVWRCNMGGKYCLLQLHK